MARAPRSTATRDKHRRYIRRTKPPCALCGGEIDYSLHYLNPMAYVVDHRVPIARGGEDTIQNIQAAHRTCNESKGAKLDSELKPAAALRSYVTSRTW